MSSVIKKVSLHSQSIPSEEMRIEIPKKGGASPTSRRSVISGLPKILKPVVISSTNYVPGRINFKTDEVEEQ